MTSENNTKIENVQLWEVRKGRPTEVKVFGYIVAIRDDAPKKLNVVEILNNLTQIIDLEKTKVINNLLVEPDIGIEKIEQPGNLKINPDYLKTQRELGIKKLKDKA